MRFCFLIFVFSLSASVLGSPCERVWSSDLLSAEPLESSDLREAEALELKLWGTEMAASMDRLESRLQVFPEGQLRLRNDGRLVGILNSQIIYEDQLKDLEREEIPVEGAWSYFTDSGSLLKTHTQKGDVLFLINISAEIPPRGNKKLQRSNIAEKLLNGLIEYARKNSFQRIYGITRINAYKKYCDQRVSCSVQSYLDEVESGALRDPALSFHLRMGASVVKAVRNAMPEDDASLGYGALIRYDL